MEKDIDFYYYDVDMGAYDEYNPRYVFCNDIYRKAIFDIVDGKKANEECLLKLIGIDAIQIKEEAPTINFPLFIKEDLPFINKATKDNARKVVDRIKIIYDELCNILVKLDNGFSNKINMYHIICGNYFDGEFFSYLEERGIVATSMLHPSNRDYIIIGYEKDEKLQEWNDSLICSYNNFRTNNYRFCSFGNALGDRYDLYRYIRVREGGNILPMFGDIHSVLKRYEEDEIKILLDDVMNGVVNDDMRNILNLFGYFKNNESIVPIYTKQHYHVINELYELLNKMLGEYIVEVLNEMYDELADIYIMKLKLNKQIIMNELWHMLFGSVNEILIQDGLVATPYTSKDEGCYLKCIWEI